jgi:glycosyltransferase involved in cell wall biosynthesis
MTKALTNAALRGRRGVLGPPVLRPRSLALAASIAWRHVTADPVRVPLLAWRVLPPRLRRGIRYLGPYGTAAALWSAGERTASLASLGRRPRRLAAFALAVDQPQAARTALAAVPDGAWRRQDLLARLAWREGRLTDAARALDGARGRRAGRLRAALAESVVTETGTAQRSAVRCVPGRVLHIVTDALPSTSAGYTIRTHEIAVAQRQAGLDPHIVTPPGYPVTAGSLDGRRLVTLDQVPYHRLLPWTLPRSPSGSGTSELALRLARELRPQVLHPASNYQNARIALGLRDRLGIPVVYEVRGFWEDTWLSRHPGEAEALRASERYQAIRDEETRCMRAADLVITLGEAMREEIAGRGVSRDKIEIVPNAVSPDFLRELIPVAHADYVVGTVTTLVPHEGLGTLLDATKILAGRGIPARALIVGDGPELAALRRHAEITGTNATFTGRVPAAKVRDFHALLDVFVVPRTRDRVCQLVTPLKPVEAMASGLCVVTSELSALAEIVKHQVTGALTMPQDPVSLADCLEFLFYSPDIRVKLGTAAREWVAADRTWSRNAVRYQQAYARLTTLTAH